MARSRKSRIGQLQVQDQQLTSSGILERKICIGSDSRGWQVCVRNVCLFKIFLFVCLNFIEHICDVMVNPGSTKKGN